MHPRDRARSRQRDCLLAAGLLAAGLCVDCSGSGGGGSGPVVAAAVAASSCSNTSMTPVGGPTESVTIDVPSNDGAAAPLVGFVLGIAAPSGPDYNFPADTTTRIAALNPTLWKVTDWSHYVKVRPFGAAIMFASSDAYFNYQPIYYPWNDTGTATGTFDNWHNFDAHERGLLQTSLTQAAPVPYWTILSEPQPSQYSATDQQRLLDTISHGYHDFKDGHPEQKVVAPTTIGYDKTLMQRVLDFAVSNNLLFDAIDWHEFARPEDVAGHVQNLRTLLGERPSLGNPPVIIDEYATAAQHLLPGFAVGWFYYLEKSGVQLASRACWNVMDPANGVWADCWDGLDGLFMKDNSTPQALYWVFNRYAQMPGRKLTSTSSAPNDVVALARSTSTDPSTGGVISVLVGRFSSDNTIPAGPTRDITVQLQGLPAATNALTVDVERIPYCGPDVMTTAPMALALPAPISLGSFAVPVAGGNATMVLPAFHDRDAYYLRFR